MQKKLTLVLDVLRQSCRIFNAFVKPRFGPSSLTSDFANIKLVTLRSRSFHCCGGRRRRTWNHGRHYVDESDVWTSKIRIANPVNILTIDVMIKFVFALWRLMRKLAYFCFLRAWTRTLQCNMQRSGKSHSMLIYGINESLLSTMNFAIPLS